ncbi:hypothetical protein [Rhizobium grahamii]|uniref:NapC/NirT cytochrome C domain-containing protein n=1 Tax=Rhizobium grahamii CCGE 502 TaxID=990285 RepID=S3HDN8_9HYPH|nr:hypothetical protein [Rhizobium grahamii]EPE96165.1 NapC/NirT cytochrome C domain-containing protein [Rhizobium grahamii CCGE 502]
MDGVDPGWKIPKELEGNTIVNATPIDDLQRAIAEAQGIVPIGSREAYALNRRHAPLFKRRLA